MKFKNNDDIQRVYLYNLIIYKYKNKISDKIMNEYNFYQEEIIFFDEEIKKLIEIINNIQFYNNSNF